MSGALPHEHRGDGQQSRRVGPQPVQHRGGRHQRQRHDHLGRRPRAADDRQRRWRRAFPGTIGGQLSLAKAGTGTISLSGNNSYSGVTYINNGILSLGSTAAIPSGGAGGVTFGGGTLQYTAANGSQDYSNYIISSGSAISIDLNGQTVTFGNPLSSTNSGGLTVNSSQSGGMLILTASNNYGGTTSVSSGTLQLGTNGALPTITPLTVNGSGVFDLNKQNATVDSLNGNGTIASVLGGSPLLTIGSNNGGGSFSGTINGSQVALTKTGTGTEIVSGPNTYGGLTSINAGIINYQNATAFGANSPITVAAGAPRRRCRAGSPAVARR